MYFIIFHSSGSLIVWLFTALYVHVCMLTGLCDIILLATCMHCLCVLWLAFCYICLFICFICCILSLLNCTELPTWLLGWFADLLITWLLTCNGRVGWLAGWLPIWLTGYAGAVLHNVANHRLLSLRLVWTLNTERQGSDMIPSVVIISVTVQLHNTFLACDCVALSGP